MDIKQIKITKINAKTLLLILGFVLALSLITGWFYWFEWKPTEVRKNCYQKVKDSLKGKEGSVSGFNNVYRACLVEHGMKPESVFVSN